MLTSTPAEERGRVGRELGLMEVPWEKTRDFACRRNAGVDGPCDRE